MTAQLRLSGTLRSTRATGDNRAASLLLIIHHIQRQSSPSLFIYEHMNVISQIYSLCVESEGFSASADFGG